MGSLLIVIFQPLIKVALQFFQAVVKFFSERDSIKLLLHGTVKALTDAIALRMADLCFTVLNTFNLQI